MDLRSSGKGSGAEEGGGGGMQSRRERGKMAYMREINKNIYIMNYYPNRRKIASAT